MNFYAFHIGDYASATRHLSWDEDMAYRRLMDAYYTREAPIPLDERQVFRLVQAQTEAQREAVKIVLEEFFEMTPDGWRNARCEEEIASASSKREKARASAMLSVKSREKKNADLRAMRIKEARGNGTHTKDEWSALVTACGGRCVSCGSDENIQKDHITPIYQGGDDSIENLQPLCRSCNASKGPDNSDMRPKDWRTSVERTLSERSTNAGDLTSERSDFGSECSAPNPNPNPNPNISISDEIDNIKPPSPTRAGTLCRMLRRIGIQAAPHMLAHPDWQAILERFDDEAIIGAAELARSNNQKARITINYLVPILNAPPKPPPTASPGQPRRASTGRQAIIDNYAAQAAAARGEGYGQQQPTGEHDITGQCERIE